MPGHHRCRARPRPCRWRGWRFHSRDNSARHRRPSSPPRPACHRNSGSLRFHGAGALQRLVDRLAGDELLAHHAHRHIDAAADHRLARAGDQARQCCGKTAVADGGGELAGDDETPGRGIDEKRAPAAEMRLPVAGGDLVADQRIAGVGVRDTQQRFRQAHQRHAFLRGERIFMHQPFDAGSAVLRPQRLDQRRCRLSHLPLHRVRQLGGGQQRSHAFHLRPAIGGGNGGAKRALRRMAGAKAAKGDGETGMMILPRTISGKAVSGRWFHGAARLARPSPSTTISPQDRPR